MCCWTNFKLRYCDCVSVISTFKFVHKRRIVYWIQQLVNRWFVCTGCCKYLLPLVDVKAIILQFLLQNIWEADVNMHNLLLTLPLNIKVWFNPLKQRTYETSVAWSMWANSSWFDYYQDVIKYASDPRYHFVNILREGAIPAVWRFRIRIVPFTALWRWN